MRRTAGIVAGLLLITANLIAGSAAQAHDEVVSVQPEAGSSVAAGVIDLSVTFNEDVMTTDGTNGFDIAVADASGEAQQVGCIDPMGATLSGRVAIAKAGDYTVTWHSVSNDGHPNEGTYKFTVTGEATIYAGAVDACPKMLIAPAPGEPSAIAYTTTAVANDNSGIEIGVLIAVVVIVIAAAIWVTTRRKKAKN